MFRAGGFPFNSALTFLSGLTLCKLKKAGEKIFPTITIFPEKKLLRDEIMRSRTNCLSGATQRSSTTVFPWKSNAPASHPPTAPSSTPPSLPIGSLPYRKSPGAGLSSDNILQYSNNISQYSHNGSLSSQKSP